MSSIVFNSICRLCVKEDNQLVNLYSKDSNLNVATKGTANIFGLIERFTTIKISSTDNLPQKICQTCVRMLNSILAFQNNCLRSDVKLRSMKRKFEENTNDSLIEIEILDDSEQKDVAHDSIFDLETEDENSFEYNHQTTVKTIDNSIGETETYPRWRPQKIACHICGKLYEAYKLRFHFNKHNGLKPYECDEHDCTSKFAAPHELNKHKKLCHVDGPKLFCDVCGKGFKVKLALNTHRSYHFDPQIPCTVCKKLFRNSKALKKHMLVHSQERNFPCDLCEKSFQTRYTLRIHKRVHTLEKPYKCSKCGQAFAYKCLLKGHTEKFHAN